MRPFRAQVHEHEFRKIQKGNIAKSLHHLVERGWFGRLIQRMKFAEEPLAPANASAHGVHAMFPIEIEISVEQALPLRVELRTKLQTA